MKNLIHHLIRENQEEVLARSLWNCHAKGLHSIMLSETPGKTIRMFVTTEDHELWMNDIRSEKLSIAYHPHHCNVTLHCIKGAIINARRSEGGDVSMKKFRYNSAITSDKMKFELISDVNMSFVTPSYLFEDDSDFMHASEIHTIFVSQKEVAAWLVYEGRENPKYESVAYAPNDLTQVSSEGLYKKMEARDIKHLLQITGLAL